MTTQPATLRGAVDIPLTPARSRRTLEDDLASAGSARVSPIQLSPAPQPAQPRPVVRQTAPAAKPEVGDAKPDGRRRPLVHGLAGYNRGCRCETCTTAKREANRRYAERRAAR